METLQLFERWVYWLLPLVWFLPYFPFVNTFDGSTAFITSKISQIQGQPFGNHEGREVDERERLSVFSLCSFFFLSNQDGFGIYRSVGVYDPRFQSIRYCQRFIVTFEPFSITRESLFKFVILKVVVQCFFFRSIFCDALSWTNKQTNTCYIPWMEQIDQWVFFCFRDESVVPAPVAKM
jgi:hypothetical protein